MNLAYAQLSATVIAATHGKAKPPRYEQFVPEMPDDAKPAAPATDFASWANALDALAR